MQYFTRHMGGRSDDELRREIEEASRNAMERAAEKRTGEVPQRGRQPNTKRGLGYDQTQALRKLLQWCDRENTVEGARISVDYGMYDATVVCTFNNGIQKRHHCDGHREANQVAKTMRGVIAGKWNEAVNDGARRRMGAGRRRF